MRIVCPNCATSYELGAASLGAGGRTVRCARCRETWRAGGGVAVAVPVEVVEWERLPAALPPAIREHGDPARPRAGTDFAEDDFDTAVVADAPPLAPEDDLAASVPGEPAEAAADAEPEDIETVAARRARSARDARGRGRRPKPLPLVILGCAAILAGLVVWRTDVVRLAPQTARLYDAVGLPVNLRGLVFEDLEVSGETRDDVPVMVVRGRIVNPTREDAEVPRLRFAVRNKAGVEVYAWTALPDQPTLKAGESLPFRSRLASPPADAKDVMVRFFHRRDLQSGT
jgi:predicted Zn finger-like uncharacterized protein